MNTDNSSSEVSSVSPKFDCTLSQDVPILNDLSYETFYQDYLLKNLPCLIQNVAKDWSSTKFWCEKGKPSMDHLKTKYGDSTITVHHCDQKFDCLKTSTMKFKDYVDYWKNYDSAQDKRNTELLYLKDWHMRNEYKDDEFYKVPKYFSSDWLNEYLIANNKDDYRFVYMGPAGSWTPLHKDVLDSFSWSVNICGFKKWILFPPGQEFLLSNKNGQLPHSIEKLPKDIKYFIVMQHPGDALFVPSQWYHQVWNLEDTISINHNWVNAANIDRMKSRIYQGLLETKEELKHLSSEENYLDVCQVVLRCHVGMNSEDFFKFISFIALKRMEEYRKTFFMKEVKDVIEFELKQIEKLLSENWGIGHDQDEVVAELKTQIEDVLNC